jgi:hypothetical protein
MGLLTKTQTRPWAGFLAGTHGLGRALAGLVLRILIEKGLALRINSGGMIK